MSETEQIICDICKKPIEAREELAVALNNRDQHVPLHTNCYPNSKVKREFRYRYRIIHGKLRLVDYIYLEIWSILCIFLFLILLMEVQTPIDWMGSVLVSVALLFTLSRMIRSWFFVRGKVKVNWKLYEGKLPGK